MKLPPVSWNPIKKDRASMLRAVGAASLNSDSLRPLGFSSTTLIPLKLPVITHNLRFPLQVRDVLRQALYEVRQLIP